MGVSRSAPETERDWIVQAQRGDREAFGRLVELHQRRIFSLAFRLVRRKDDVEDLVQEIFLKAFQAIRGYNFQSSLGTWLGRIAVNHCYDYLRRERSSRVRYFGQMPEETQRQIEDRAETATRAEGIDHEQAAVVKETVKALLERAPADDRVILVLKEMEDYSVEEIAELLGLRQGTVKVRLHRARKRMLKDLKRWREGG